jgi:radical SAM/Cys-rich protein
MPRSLLVSGHQLAVIDVQRETLRPGENLVSFEATLRERGIVEFRRARSIETLQINVGKLCNQTCKHCHVDAGPDRRESASDAVLDACVAFVEKTPSIKMIDLTGGAPEMHPRFRSLIATFGRLGRRVVDRCNLTILSAPGYRDLPEYLAEHRVEIVASLPYFEGAQTDRQRGDGVFEKSIEALRRLNRLGYGRSTSGLKLNLVYNPVGAFLPGDQQELEALFRRKLKDEYDVEFNNLFAIVNQPINRFLEYLLRSGNFDDYMARLVAAFNPSSVDGLMCRTTLSVGWDGRIYDCDFNQMLELPIACSARTIGELVATDASIAAVPIVTGSHCYACTAGQGSSCGGAVVRS